MITTFIICTIILIVAMIRRGNQNNKRTDSIDFLKSESDKSYYFLFDTETSGLPKYRTEDYKKLDVFPRILQIAYIVFDESERLVKNDSAYISISVSIDPGAFKVHGINQQKLLQLGRPPEEIFTHIAQEIEKARVIVVHNQSFDIPILKSELFRLGYDVEKIFQDKPVICTMESTSKFVGLKRNNGYEPKYPKLTELYGKLFYNNTNINIREAHDASSDVLILAKCFSELSQRKIIDITGIRELVANREIIESFDLKLQTLLSLHKLPKSILIYNNLEDSEIDYLSESSKDQVQYSILQKAEVDPEFNNAFKIKGIRVEKQTLSLSMFVDLASVTPRSYPDLTRKNGEITWKEFSTIKYFEVQSSSLYSAIIKIAHDFFEHHPRIDTIEKEIFVSGLNKAKGIDEDQRIMSISIPRKSFYELNLERIDPAETIKLFTPTVKFLKTKGFQILG